MKKRTKWEKKLTTQEINHVRVWCGGTLRGLKSARLQQEKQRIIDSQTIGHDAMEPCWDCKMIAIKLGLEGRS